MALRGREVEAASSYSELSGLIECRGEEGALLYFNISLNSESSASDGTVGFCLYALWKSMGRPGLQIQFLTSYKKKMVTQYPPNMESVYLGKVALSILLKCRKSLCL